MSRLHTLTVVVRRSNDDVVAVLRIDTSQRRQRWFRCEVSELSPGTTVQTSGDSCELVDARRDDADRR